MIPSKRHLKRNVSRNASIYSRIYVAMLGCLSRIRFSDRYNAVYDPEIFHKMMIKAVMAGSNLASVVNAVLESGMATSARNPCMPTECSDSAQRMQGLILWQGASARSYPDRLPPSKRQAGFQNRARPGMPDKFKHPSNILNEKPH